MTISGADSINRKWVYLLALVLGYTLLGALYINWTWTDELGLWGGDNAWYIHTARYFSPYTTPTSPTSIHYALNSPYPPMMSLILALFGGAESMKIAHLITTLHLLAAIILIYLLAINITGSRLIAIVTVVIFATFNTTYVHVLEVLSENYYLFYSLLALYLITIHEKHNNPYTLYLAALASGCTYLVRSTGVTIIATFILYLLIRNRSKSGIFPAVVSLLPAALLHVFDYKLDTQDSYMKMLNEKFSSFESTGEVILHFTDHTTNFLLGWAQMLGASTTATYLLAYVFGLAAMYTLFKRLRAFKADAIYVVFYGGLLLAWPFSPEAERYLYPVVPLLLVYGLNATYVIDNRLNSLGKFIPVTLATCLLIGTGNALHLAKYYNRSQMPVPEGFPTVNETRRWYHTENFNETLFDTVAFKLIQNGIETIKQAVPEGECVLSIKPPIIALYSDRISYPLPLTTATDEHFRQLLMDSSCNYIYILPFGSITYSVPHYPINRIKGYSRNIFTVRHDGYYIGGLYKIIK